MGEAARVARKDAEFFRGTGYASYAYNCGPVEKAGEQVVRRFFDYFSIRYTKNGDPYLPPFIVSGLNIDVHTRALKFKEQYDHYGLTGGNLNIERFPGIVPELGLLRSADIYVFCGFDVCSYEGFLFGWTDSGTLAEVELSTGCKYPAKFVKLSKLYSPHSLLDELC